MSIVLPKTLGNSDWIKEVDSMNTMPTIYVNLCFFKNEMIICLHTGLPPVLAAITAVRMT